MKKWPILIFFFVSLVTASAQETPYVPCLEMPKIISNYYADIDALNNVYIFGFSPERNQRFKTLAQSYLEKLAKIDFKQLPQGCKADYALFKRNLNGDIEDSDKESIDYRSMNDWFPFADSIYSLEKCKRRAGMLNAQLVASNFSKAIKDIKVLKSKADLSKSINVPQARIANNIIDGLIDALKNTNRFYSGYDPMYTWWVPDLYKELDIALKDYAKTFTVTAEKNAPVKDSTGIVGFPIGKDELIRQLKYEIINYTPEELIAIANKEFAWCDKELLKVATDMGFGNDWKAAQEKVKQSAVPPGSQAAEMVKLYNQSIEFIKNKDLITLPDLANETWRIAMMSPQQQLYNPFFYGGEEFAISYPTNTMDYDAKLMSMRGNNPHFCRAVVHHEVLPGHYLQHFMNERVNTYRRYDTPFWTEGWALYWELLLWDEGFARGPEDRIGMLYWRMHRCARIIFSLNYHMGKWTPQQCIDFLVDRVGHERANAEAEVRRSFAGGYGPLYQVAYMLGGLEFMSLKNEMTKGGKMTVKQFNDAVMQQNTMPIEMLRNILLDLPIKKDYNSGWKFYGK